MFANPACKAFPSRKERLCQFRMKGYCYTSDGKAIEKKFSDKLWSKYQDWEKDVPSYSSLRSRYVNLPQPRVIILYVNIAHDFRASYQSHMRTMFERHLHQEYPEHARRDMRSVFNCLHNYQLFHHAAADLSDVPLPNLVKIRVPGENVQVYQDVPGANIQVMRTWSNVHSYM